jgi:hypothetical protein
LPVWWSLRDSNPLPPACKAGVSTFCRERYPYNNEDFK